MTRQTIIQQAQAEYERTRGYCSMGTPMRAWINVGLLEAQQPRLTTLEAEQIPGCDDLWRAPRRTDGTGRILKRDECMRGTSDEGVSPFSASATTRRHPTGGRPYRG